MSRLVKEEIEVEGFHLPAGKPMLIMLGAANRDPKHFKDPDKLDLARSNNTHLAFGAGAHFCIGNQIARLEAQTAILKIFQRFPTLRFANQAPQWTPNYMLRGFKSFSRLPFTKTVAPHIAIESLP